MNLAATNAILAIDIGNTAIKLARFTNAAASADPAAVQPVADILKLSSQQPLSTDALAAWWPDQRVDVFMSSVCAPARSRIIDWIRSQTDCSVHVMTRDDFPITIANDLMRPERVGHDRLAAAVCASLLKPTARPAIVVDAGSAVKVDLISAEGSFCGGAILPGWRMMANSLQHATDQLPRLAELSLDVSPPVVGKNTEAAITSGIYWGLVGSIRCLIDQMAAQCEQTPEVMLAGGDMAALASELQRVRGNDVGEPRAGADDSMKIVTNLVLRGIALSAQRLCMRAGFRPNAELDSKPSGSA